MPNPYFIIGAILAIIGAYFAGEYRGSESKDIEWKAKTYQELAEASESARKQQAMWQGVVNETASNSIKRQNELSRSLNIALDSLRSRPERPGSLPGNTGDARPCCTGAELCREDAGFLEREAHRAEGIRGGLQDAYKVIDALKK